MGIQPQDEPNRASGPLDSFFADLARGIAIAASLKPVYPFYLASRIKRGLLAAQATDPEKIIASIGEIETIGDCRYAVTVKDTNGTSYRITIAVEEAA